MGRKGESALHKLEVLCRFLFFFFSVVMLCCEVSLFVFCRRCSCENGQVCCFSLYYKTIFLIALFSGLSELIHPFSLSL